MKSLKDSESNGQDGLGTVTGVDTRLRRQLTHQSHQSLAIPSTREVATSRFNISLEN